jgi:hypothetical protein
MMFGRVPYSRRQSPPSALRTPTIPNVALIPAVVGALLQAGAQLFAVAVVVRTVTEAPPRSLAMYAGEYGYDSGPFWEVMPTVTLGLLLIALVGNWRTPRRRFLLAAVALFITAGLFTVVVMGPAQEAVVGTGYSDGVDEALRVKAAHWRMLDWASWALTLSVGVVLAAALAIPVPEATAVSHAGRSAAAPDAPLR